MGDFGAIVCVGGGVVGDRRHEVVMGDTIAAQLVRDEPTRFLSLAPQEAPQESPRRRRVIFGLL